MKLNYMKAAEAWQRMKAYHESEGHRFEEPTIENFTFVGIKYTAKCVNCGKLLFVHGGWGGAGAFGPCAMTTCPGIPKQS